MKVIIISLILIKELFSLQLKKQQSHGITNSVSSSTICSKGEYLYNNSQCVDKCPKGYYADNILHKCTTTNNAVSILAYTKKSCKGVCGQSFPECSCNVECLQEGNCCTDYLAYCKYNTTSHNRKSKCNEGLFYYNSTCIEKCPYKYKANKISMKCEEYDKATLSFYWVFPSKNSCSNSCGIANRGDCSCSYECIRYGNCCDDIDKVCPSEVKNAYYSLCREYNYTTYECVQCTENAIKDKEGSCRCKEGYTYSIKNEKCELPNASNKSNDMANVLNELFNQIIPSKIEKKESKPFNVILNGDISINIVTNATNSTINSNRITNNDSYNTAKLINKV